MSGALLLTVLSSSVALAAFGGGGAADGIPAPGLNQLAGAGITLLASSGVASTTEDQGKALATEGGSAYWRPERQS
jgi:hypothetical protein